MTARCLLWYLALGSASLAYAYMLIEEKSPPANASSNNSLQAKAPSDAPPIVIVELPRAARRTKKEEKKQKKVTKNKFGGRSRRPPPPGSCVPLSGRCKPPHNTCCEHCAFCLCRLFKTACYCRMGNPRC